MDQDPASPNRTLTTEACRVRELRFAEFRIDLNQMQLFRDGAPVAIGRKISTKNAKTANCTMTEETPETKYLTNASKEFIDPIEPIMHMRRFEKTILLTHLKGHVSFPVCNL